MKEMPNEMVVGITVPVRVRPKLAGLSLDDVSAFFNKATPDKKRVHLDDLPSERCPMKD